MGVQRAKVVPGGVSTALLFLWLALAGPAIRSVVMPGSEPLLVISVGATAALVSFISAPHMTWFRFAVAVAGGLTLLPGQGRTLAIWLTIGLLIAAWVAQRRPPLPFLPCPGPGATMPTIVLAGAAIWQGLTVTATWQPLVPMVAAGVVPLASRWRDGALDRFVHRVGHFAAALVSSFVFTLMSVPVLLVPWALQRLHLSRPPRRGFGWTRRSRRTLRPPHPWAAEPASRVAEPGERNRRLVAFTAVGLLLIAAVVGFSLRSGHGPDARSVLGAEELATERPAWYPEYREDIEWVLDERVALRPFEVYRLLDVETRHVNIRDGDRVTWRAPGEDADSLTVWLYGGGAAFGLEQRDEHTIASNLARVAADNGVSLKVVNRAIPGQLHWRNALRFGWDLAVEERPDLAIFYEGAEEIEAAEQLLDRDLGDVRAPYEPFLEDTYDEVQHVAAEVPEPPAGTEYLGWPTVEGSEDIDSAGRLATARWTRSLEISTNLAEHYDVPVMYVWQANRPTDEERRVLLEASGSLPATVTDLSRLLDDEDDVRFTDAFHHGEQGALLVAEQMFTLARAELGLNGGGR